jgi:hypothetical protein
MTLSHKSGTVRILATDRISVVGTVDNRVYQGNGQEGLQRARFVFWGHEVLGRSRGIYLLIWSQQWGSSKGMLAWCTKVGLQRQPIQHCYNIVG